MKRSDVGGQRENGQGEPDDEHSMARRQFLKKTAMYIPPAVATFTLSSRQAFASTLANSPDNVASSNNEGGSGKGDEFFLIKWIESMTGSD